MLRFGELAWGNVAGYREANLKVCEIPFNSNNKFQVIVIPNSAFIILIVKSAILLVITVNFELCNPILCLLYFIIIVNSAFCNDNYVVPFVMY